MTEERHRELVKKAIDVIRNHSHRLVDNFTQEDVENREISIFFAGYHECQKEHEWHYVKDGDFPKEKCLAVVFLDTGLLQSYLVKEISEEEMKNSYGNIIKWKEIE